MILDPDRCGRGVAPCDIQRKRRSPETPDSSHHLRRGNAIAIAKSCRRSATLSARRRESRSSPAFFLEFAALAVPHVDIGRPDARGQRLRLRAIAGERGQTREVVAVPGIGMKRDLPWQRMDSTPPARLRSGHAALIAQLKQADSPRMRGCARTCHALF
jgi:hypothetical protein